MKISSPAFENNQKIPSKYTCDGENINSPLAIAEVPEQARSLVLIMDDPDAPMGTWVHWLLWNIDPKTTEILENSVPKDTICGTNTGGNTNYDGPCPPSGTHRYFFRLYALDTKLNLDSSANRAQLDEAMKNHVIAQAELVGLYTRG